MAVKRLLRKWKVTALFITMLQPFKKLKVEINDLICIATWIVILSLCMSRFIFLCVVMLYQMLMSIYELLIYVTPPLTVLIKVFCFLSLDVIFLTN